MAIAIGALVDDAIIDVENVVRRLRENQREARGRATRGVGRRPRRHARDPHRRSSSPPSSSCWCSCRSSAWPAIEGRLLSPLAFAYIVALLGIAGRRDRRDAGAVLRVPAERAVDSAGTRRLADADAESAVRRHAAAVL